MVYNSLFREEDFHERRIAVERPEGYLVYLYPHNHYLSYKGTLESVLRDLESMKEINLTETDSHQKIIWGAPRIIRGVLDYKIGKKPLLKAFNLPELVLTATQAVIDIYSDPLRISQAVREVQDYFSSNNSLDKILNAEVRQKGDDTTFDSTSPIYSDNTVSCLLNKFKGRDLLFILGAHGGVPAGLDVFLKYQSASEDGDSIVYPIRCSADKFSDQQLQLDKTEIEYLRDARGKRPVVIFDEDISSGETIKMMEYFLKEKVFKRQKSFVISNSGGIEVMEHLNGFKWKPREESLIREDTSDYIMPFN